MSTRYNTGNPIESTDVRDMSDNAKNFDEFSVSTQQTFTDRFGVARKTLPSLISKAESDIYYAVINAGFQPASFDFVTGGTLVSGERNRAVFNPAPSGDNNWYAWQGAFPKIIYPNSTPSTSGGLGDNAWKPVTNNITAPTVMESIRRSYAEAGYNVVGTLQSGFTYVNQNDVGIDLATGKGYTGPAGPVAAGTDPASGGFVDVSQNKYMVASIAELRIIEPVTDGQRINVRGYYADTPLQGGGTFVHDATSSASDDAGNVIVTAGGKRWLRWKPVTLGFVDAQNFGCIAPRDISTLLQKALDTKFNVQLSAGAFTSSVTFNRHKGQIISGAGIPERSLTELNGITVLTFTADVAGFDSTPNVALGGGIKNMILVAPANSTKLGIKDGIKGQEGGSSQAIGCLHENLIIKNFASPYQLSGWAWETTLRRVIADTFSEYGFDVTDAANIVHLDNCSAILSATKPSGARTGIRVDKAICVHLTAFRSENNRNGGEFSGGAVVSFNGFYAEGNRDNDIIVRDPGTTLVGVNLVQLHSNDGTNTVSGINTKPSCNQTTLIDITGVRVRVTAGKAEANNTMSNYYVGEGPATALIKGVDWSGDGNLWAAFSGRFAPTEMTILQLAGVRIIGDRFGFGSRVIMDSWPSPTPPTSASFNLTDYDGAVKSVLTTGSRVISNTFSNGVDYWIWDGASFVASNR